MKNKALYFQIPLTLLLFFSSCQLVDLDEAPSEDMMEVQLPSTIPTSIEEFENDFHGGSERSWRATTFSLAGLEGLQNCRLDDVTTINSDGTYSYDGGALLCGAEDDTRFRTGTWRIINEGNNILFDEGQANEYVADVDGFENGTLVLSGQYVGLVVTGVYSIEQ